VRILILGMGWFPESPGGLNRYALDLLNALRERWVGVEGVVIGSGNLDRGFVGVSAPGAPLLQRLWITALEGRARARAADVVNSHFALYTLPMVWRRGHKPLVVNFHGPWHEEAAAESNEPLWLTALRKHIETSVYRRANDVIVLSDAFRRIVVDDFGILPGRVHVVRPGVDLDHFCALDQGQARSRLGLVDHERVVLSVRRLTNRVGLDVLLSAWSTAGTENATLYIVGDGPERNRLRVMATDLGIDHSVRFVGAVSDADLPLWYASADVTVVPSVALEGFGLVVLESLACGTPVIASDTGGMAEVLPDLGGSLLVPPGDASALRTALTRSLHGDHALPNRKDCRSFAETFHWTKTADHVIEIFSQARSRPPDRKYRVVFLDHCAKLSGGELALLRLLRGAKNIEPHVILAEDGPLVQRLREANISTEILPLLPGVANLSREELQTPSQLLRGAGATTMYAARLARRLRRLHPDLVHTNSLKSGLYGSLAGRAAGIPVVWHLRDRLSEDSYPALQAAALRRCVRTMPNAVIANSTASGNLLSRGRAPVWVIPSPIDLVPAARSVDGPPVVGIVGRLAPWKGQHVFLEAVAHLYKRHYGLRARIIGSALFGEEEYPGSLRRLAEDLEISEIVEFAGFSHDIAGELAQLTVAVHASTVPEPFGQVVVEAMACGVPIVATDGGGPAEVVSHGIDGLLVRPGDANAMANAMDKLLEDGNLRSRLAEAGTLKAQQYRPERVASEVEAVYAALLAGEDLENS
jgi:glycosyltransferase involved in cell wall biosynthesis